MEQTPPKETSGSQPRIAGSIKFLITGGEAQFLEIYIRPGQKCIGELANITYMPHNINPMMQTKHLNSANRTFFETNNLQLCVFENITEKEQKVGFSTPFRGRVVPIDLEKAGMLFFSSKYFLCSHTTTRILPIASKDMIGEMLSSNDEGKMMKMTGSAFAFFHAVGHCKMISLKPEETFMIPEGSIIATQSSITHKIVTVANTRKMSSLTGPGTVWINATPHEVYLDATSNATIKKVGGHFGLKKSKSKFGLLGALKKK